MLPKLTVPSTWASASALELRSVLGGGVEKGPAGLMALLADWLVVGPGVHHPPAVWESCFLCMLSCVRMILFGETNTGVIWEVCVYLH